jgi:hypothetical protein
MLLCSFGSQLITDYIPGHDQLNAAIPSPSLRSAIVSDRICLSQACGSHVVHAYSRTHQIIAHRFGPLFRKSLVIFVASDGIGKALHFQLQIRICQYNPGDPCHALTGLWLKPKFQIGSDSILLIR